MADRPEALCPRALAEQARLRPAAPAAIATQHHRPVCSYSTQRGSPMKAEIDESARLAFRSRRPRDDRILVAARPRKWIDPARYHLECPTPSSSPVGTACPRSTAPRRCSPKALIPWMPSSPAFNSLRMTRKNSPSATGGSRTRTARSSSMRSSCTGRCIGRRRWRASAACGMSRGSRSRCSAAPITR